jgi:glutathione S-transferase
MLKVYDRANAIIVRKVLWMLGELGLDCEREDWGRGHRSTEDPLFRKINPVGVVPVIDDGDIRLRESHTIVRYLANKHGRADLYPQELRQRTTVECSMDWAATEFASGMQPALHGLVVKNPAFAPIIDGGSKDWSAQMRVLDDHLTRAGPYSKGNTFTIADIPIGLMVNRWIAIDSKKPEFKAVLAYYDRLAERTLFRAHGRNGLP